MKKLEKLVLQDVVPIPEKEQRSLYGGGSVVTIDGFTYYCPGSIEISMIKDPPEGGWVSVCPACQNFHEYNENHPMSHGEPVTTPFGEFIFNTLPHILGWGQHVNGDEVYYTLTLTDGTVIEYTKD
ncbi:MAG: hypothetical protein QUS12_06930 [Methanosarcina sp.]|nr:hypothetical protein [Methanosarcina sp.]